MQEQAAKGAVPCAEMHVHDHGLARVHKRAQSLQVWERVRPEDAAMPLRTLPRPVLVARRQVRRRVASVEKDALNGVVGQNDLHRRHAADGCLEGHVRLFVG